MQRRGEGASCRPFWLWPLRLYPLFVVDSGGTWKRSAAMRARVVDWSLLILVVAEVVSGLWSFTVGKPAGRWLFWLHGAVGLALLPLLGYKFARVARRVVEPQRWQWATPVSLLTALAAFGTVGIGVYWVLWQS